MAVMYSPRRLRNIRPTLPNTKSNAAYLTCFLYGACVAITLLSSGCGLISLTRPITKIGLIAPFEGQQRAVGYEALYAVKLALRERNELGGVGGWNVELTALDSSNQRAQALRQTLSLAVDPDVVFALAVSAAPDRTSLQSQLTRQSMPFDVIIFPAEPVSAIDPAFAARYRAASGGIEPSALAVRTYESTLQALTWMSEQSRFSGKPAR
jgi:hypothetical protein